MKFEDRFNVSKGGGDLFIKLEDGESVTGVFAGDPCQFQQHNQWPQPPVVCTGEDCSKCAAGDRPSTRFRINMIVNDSGTLRAKIFEQSYYTWTTLQELNNEYDLERFTVKIKRTGTGTDTRYTILPTPDGKIDDAAFAKLSEIEVNDLHHKGVKPTPQESSPPVYEELSPSDEELPPFDADDDLPF